MGGVVGGLWDTVQGKKHVRRACDRVFHELAVDRRLKLSDLHLATMMVYSSVNKQYLSPYKEPPTKKMVEAKIKELIYKKKKETDAKKESNTQHSNGKTKEKQDDTTKEKQEGTAKEKQEDNTKNTVETETKKKSEIEQKNEDGSQTIDNDEFYEIILEWLKKDLQIVLANKLLLALMGGPALAIITKSAGRRVPKINHVVEKVPTPVLIPAYATGIALLQDVRLE
ncbi:hypothetical protein J5N97_018867 [Dioscorea zingiberensis]|uniref:Uncharacterized protein n=1 Tax=Dioscorea zingiberensis TaxID=325984 RepID=A0A9D5HCB4_9LILI|nr:hypothetical protein J5N97_018867 [Dioscorea zingiberensis]